jgi:hypothetical protein
MSRAIFPSREEGLALHQRLASGERSASADVCVAYLDSLVAWLQSCRPWVDSDLVQSAAHDALFDYVQHPQKYQPEQSDLAAYLRMLAEGDLLNLQRKEGRHNREKMPLESVELGEEAGKLNGREEEPAILLERQETVAGLWRMVENIRALCEPRERAVLDLMVEGERRTQVYAGVLGLEDRPPAEQEREVKRVKDCLKKRLLRGGNGHE